MSEREAYKEPRLEGSGDRRTNGDRSPEELQYDIERHRHNLDSVLSELGNKLSPGELLDEGLNYLRTGPGEFVTELAHTAKRNPVPVVLTAVGLAWLAFGQRQPSAAQDRESATTPASEPHSSVDELVDLYGHYLLQEYPFEEDEIECIIYDDFGPETYGSYQTQRASDSGLRQKATSIKHGVEKSFDQAHDKTSEVFERAQDNAAELREQVLARLDRVRSRMGEAGAEAAERMMHARDVAWRRAQRAKSAGKYQAQAAWRRSGEFVSRYPLSTVAVGLAAGIALGTTLPLTRREEQAFGETGEALREQGREKFRETAEQARAAVTSVRDAAVDEARRQGLTPEDARDYGRELREKSEHVAAAAREESEHQGLDAEGLGEDLHRGREKVEHVAAAAREAARREAEKNR